MGIKISYENRQCVSAVCVWGGGNRRYRPFGGWNPAYHQDKTKNRNKAIEREWNPLCVLEMTPEHITGKEAIELVRQHK